VEFRIGERDSATGLYQVIWPDGGVTLNGMKIFNAEHRVGDVVQATRRSDGMMILDGPKAVDEPVGLFGAVPGGKPDGYLRGQIWNDEDELAVPSIAIDFAPDTSTVLDRYEGSFTVRITIKEKQSKDLRFRVELAGTAISGVDYSPTDFNPDQEIIIGAGQKYKDISIGPIYAEVDYTNNIIVNLKPSRLYKTTKSSITLPLVPITFRYRISTNIYSPQVTTSFVEQDLYLLNSNKTAYEAEWISITTSLPALTIRRYELRGDLVVTEEEKADGWTGRYDSFIGVSTNSCSFVLSFTSNVIFLRQDRRLPPSL
jgi:hypothetical protein